MMEFLTHRTVPGANRSTRITAILIILLTVGSSVVAQSSQEKTNSAKDSVSYGLVPVATFSSELGFVFGAIGTRYHLSDDVKPFRNQLLLNLVASTKGYYSAQIIFEQVQAFDTPLRNIYEVEFNQLFEDFYFGIGNEAPYEQSKFDNGVYFFESFNNAFTYTGRYPMIEHSGDAYTDWLFEIGYEYLKPTSNGSATKLAIDRPPGFEGAFTPRFGVGFVYENRDNELDPTKGNYLRYISTFSPAPISDYGFTRTWVDARQYYTVSAWLDWTLAARVQWMHLTGEAPFWMLPEAGYNSSLRGYPLRRFLGKGALTANIELRSWLLSFDFMNTRLGGHIFTDAGRTFSGISDYKHLAQNVHQTWGLGGVISLFNPNFILRIDLGFSDEMTLFYSGIGYLF